MFGKTDAEKYQSLFGILALISLLAGLYESLFALTAFWIYIIAAIIMIFVEYYTKKTNTTPIKFDKKVAIVAIIVTFILLILTVPSQKNPQIGEYYTEGINNFNSGVTFINKGNTNLNDGDVSAAIAQFEISKDFFSNAKTNFETVVKQSDTNFNINKNKANYLMQSSDYYSKGLDELTTALRLAEKYKGTGSLTTAIELIRNPESITTISSELLEIKVSSEKAKNYFDLARNSKDSADIA